MPNTYDQEEDTFPKTLCEAVEGFMVLHFTSSDEEVIEQCPPERLEWLHSNFEKQIKSLSGLNSNNIELIKNCCPDNPNASADNASLVIMEAIRVYFQTGQLPK